MSGAVRLRLPATSANLGPGFDTAAVALDLHLELTARPAEEFTIAAQGRDAAICGRVDGNLIIATYEDVLRLSGRRVTPLELEIRNEIPLGMGCGSSAAARLAGIALAIEFGGLGWTEEDILAYATALECHPDNVTACWLGGMTVSAVGEPVTALSRRPRVDVARIEVPEGWRAAVVFPREPVRTEESRKVLPEQYSRADVVANLQTCSLLVAAFAGGNGSLLRAAMRDRLHQPYRTGICPLLERAEALCGVPGVLGAALSGAGPGMLLILDAEMERERLDRELRRTVADFGVVWIFCGFGRSGATLSVEFNSEERENFGNRCSALQ
jgi:homoserine kinase